MIYNAGLICMYVSVSCRLNMYVYQCIGYNGSYYQGCFRYWKPDFRHRERAESFPKAKSYYQACFRYQNPLLSVVAESQQRGMLSEDFSGFRSIISDDECGKFSGNTQNMQNLSWKQSKWEIYQNKTYFQIKPALSATCDKLEKG